jgi:hypothetical protein
MCRRITLPVLQEGRRHNCICVIVREENQTPKKAWQLYYRGGQRQHSQSVSGIDYKNYNECVVRYEAQAGTVPTPWNPKSPRMNFSEEGNYQSVAVSAQISSMVKFIRSIFSL